MLILSRRENERIVLKTTEGDVWVKVLGLRDGRVRLGIEAPRNVAVHREEVHDGVAADDANGAAVKTYRGWRTAVGTFVTVQHGDENFNLPSRLDVCNHSPTGFEWGFGGSGPAQLALAICCDALGVKAARECYQAFKFSHVATWRTDRPWQITDGQVNRWHAEHFGAEPAVVAAEATGE